VKARGDTKVDGAGSRQDYTSAIYSDLREGAIGSGGSIEIDTGSLYLTNDGQITADTYGRGDAGNVSVTAQDSISVNGDQSRIFSTVEEEAVGNGGTIEINTGYLSLIHGAQVAAGTFSKGNAGNVRVQARDAITIEGANSDGFSSGIFSSVQPGAKGNGGNIEIATDSLSLADDAFLGANARGNNDAGNVEVEALNNVSLSDSKISSSSKSGRGGEIEIEADDVNLSSQSNIQTDVSRSLANGGNIAIDVNTIQLHDDSNIRTNISGGEGDAGNVDLTADAVVALDDSDILAFAAGGAGGNIQLNTSAFFRDNAFEPELTTSQLENLDNNNRVDLNASGQLAIGEISTPETNFVQNELTELPDVRLDTETILSNSCIARDGQREGIFNITGAGGLPSRPGNTSASSFPTGSVQSLTGSKSNSASVHHRAWQIGDRITEPQGVYRLADGRLVMSRECSD
jgi:large exoprotein involved in heme utilization and adhesion